MMVTERLRTEQSANVTGGPFLHINTSIEKTDDENPFSNMFSPGFQNSANLLSSGLRSPVQQMNHGKRSSRNRPVNLLYSNQNMKKLNKSSVAQGKTWYRTNQVNRFRNNPLIASLNSTNVSVFKTAMTPVESGVVFLSKRQTSPIKD